MKCKCESLTHKLVGDGCEICNPTKALEYAKDTIEDLEKEVKTLEEEKREAIELLNEYALIISAKWDKTKIVDYDGVECVRIDWIKSEIDEKENRLITFLSKENNQSAN